MKRNFSISLLLFVYIFSLSLFAIPAAADENICDQFTPYTASGGFEDFESHEYKDGFLKSHFKFNSQAATHTLTLYVYLRRSSDCQWASQENLDYIGVAYIPSTINNFSFHFTSFTWPGTYTYQLYNDDTNQPLDCPGCSGGFTKLIYFDYGGPHKAQIALVEGIYSITPSFVSSAHDIVEPPKPARTPVLIVPGILGTEIFKETEKLWPDGSRMLNPFHSDDFMDPLAYKIDGTPLDTSLSIAKMIRRELTFNYSTTLINDLISSGYTEGQDLFTFPYDWRKDIHETALVDLKGQIDYILNQTQAGQSAGKVDIIAHSQGGLVTKRLLKELPEYQNKINKVVFVGVPNLGAPKAAKVLLYGDSMDIAFLGMGLDPEEVKKIGQNMPAIYELLPSAEYFNHTTGYLGKAEVINSSLPILHVKILDFSATMEYLKEQNLNSNLIDQASNFHVSDYDNLDFTGSSLKAYNIVGCQAGTMGKIFVKADGRFQLMPVAGDGTVPLFSANNIPGALTFFALESNHGTMLTQDGIRQQIMTIITGNPVSTQGKITPNISDCHFNGTRVSSHSPVDLHVYDSLGRHIGPRADGGFDFEIPNAGYDTINHENFAFLPTGGQYTVKLIANGNGSFSFDSSLIQEGQITNTAYYDAISINASSTAEIVLNSQNDQNIQLDIDGGGIFDENITPSAVLDASQSQDLTPPISTSTITDLMGNLGFYRSNVEISLSAEDPIIPGEEEQTSGLLKTVFSLNGAPFEAYQNPISVTSEGNHTLSFYSTDRAGNNEHQQTVNFTIDKTPPEFKAWFDFTGKAFQFAAEDNLDLVPQISCGGTNCQAIDAAGNITALSFKKTKVLNLYSLLLNKISYNGASFNFPDNLFSVGLLGKNLQNSAQVAVVKKQQLAGIVYSKDKNESLIAELQSNGTVKIYTLTGLHLIKLRTDKQKISVGIE